MAHLENAIDPSRRHLTHWVIFAGLTAAFVTAAMVAAFWYGSNSSHQVVEQRGRTNAALNVAVLQAELDKQRAASFILARDGDVLSAIIDRSPEAVLSLNSKLEELSAGTRASVIYVLQADGKAIAASNYRSDTSFVGNDYAFRDYYLQAMANGSAEQYALGTVSKRPGLYIARRIDGANGPVGVVVVKAEFDAIEAGWQAGDGIVYVTDTRGIVLVTGMPEWRYATERPVDADAAALIRKSLQFGDAPLSPLPIDPSAVTQPVEPVSVTAQPTKPAADFLRVSVPVTGIAWTLNLLLPLRGEAVSRIRTAQALTLLLLLPVIGGAALLLRRAHSAERSARRNRDIQAALEAGIASRTTELTESNRRLQAEMDERRAAEGREVAMRVELTQANRLAILGQVTAGVAHEINQPVGAIRAYAENAQVLLARGDGATARANLGEISRLTERIGAITEQLRGFARKAHSPIEAIDIGTAVEGALLLLRSRIRKQGVTLTIAPTVGTVMAMADRLRLEQVIANLVQNGLEAVEDQADQQILISIGNDASEATLTVEDNGAGISPEILAKLFVPFATSKPRGLGLGLVICHDIVTAFGGRMEAGRSPLGGALFKVYLRRPA